MMNEWQGGGHMAGMWLWWILGLVVIVAVVLLLARVIPGSGKEKTTTPEQELKQRYARGEIDQEEYDARLEDLRR